MHHWLHARSLLEQHQIAVAQPRRNINQNDRKKKEKKKSDVSLCNLKAMAIGVLSWRDKCNDDRCQNARCRMTHESRGETVAARLIHDIFNHT